MSDDPEQQAPGRETAAPGATRMGMLAGLTSVSMALAVGVAVLISALREQLPRIEGLNYRFIQISLVILVVAFSLYSFERERSLRKLSSDLVSHRIESARLSARLELLHEVQRERDTVAAILLASGDGICVVDPHLRIARANPALQDMTGVTEYRAKGLRCEELFGCRQAGAGAVAADNRYDWAPEAANSPNQSGKLACGASCPFEQVIMTGEALRDHVFAVRSEERPPVWISGAFAPVKDPDGRIAFAVGSLRDVTRARELEIMQGDFVSIVSHELRGPLTSMKGFIRSLVRGGDMPLDTRREFLQTMDAQTDRLNELVEDLLAVGRIESRRLKLTLTDVDLEAVTEKLAAELRTKWPERTITIETDPTLPTVRADPDAVHEVLSNLLDNALKYSPAQSEVKIVLGHDKDEAEVAVEDFGPGMRPEEVTHLFDKFRRLVAPETRDAGGSGLGLYIVKHMTEAHGGTVVVTSTPGLGSTFSVRLPFKGPLTR